MLPDVLKENLIVVFCAMAVSNTGLVIAFIVGRFFSRNHFTPAKEICAMRRDSGW
jgi:membrane protein DedA with SNARE-associated domain